MKWVLDTNVISELKRQRPNQGVVDCFASMDVEAVFTTSINISEIRFGITELESISHAAELATWLATVVRPFFQGRILEPDESALCRWHHLGSSLEKSKEPNPPVDTLIAAIAIVNGATVVTRDVVPFVATGVPIFNPWTGERFNGA